MNNKYLTELSKPDRRWQYFNATLEDLMNHVEEIQASKNVPVEILEQIEICKKLCLYSYFVYEFAAIAMERSFIVIESALKYKYKHGNKSEIKSKMSFKILLEWAAKKKIINEEYPGLNDAIRHLRNSFAHPESQMIIPPFMALWHVKKNIDIINRIFINN